MGYGPRQPSQVHSRIYHKIAALDDGATRFFLVASDLCLFSPSVYDEVAAELKKEMNVDPRQFWWTVTHTHDKLHAGRELVIEERLPGGGRLSHPAV